MAAIYVTRKIPQPGMDMLLDREPETGINPDNRALTPDELKKAVVGNDAVLCLLTDTIDVQVLENADRAVVFANFAVGFNNVDVSAATERGILVTNTPGVLTDATADMAWALLFGYLIWTDIPEPETFAGIALVVASGLFILYRERRLSGVRVSRLPRIRVR